MTKNKRGKSIMNKIAVTYENGNIFQHFGHTECFKVYEIENGEIIRETLVNVNGSGHEALAGFLKDLNVNTLICGGIGGGARRALEAAGICLYGGVSGNADHAVKEFLNGSLIYDPEAKCNHHGEHHSGDCGEHSCGEHSCKH